MLTTIRIWLSWLLDRYHIVRLKPDTTTRQQKRSRYVIVNGRTMRAMDYCDQVAAMLAPVMHRDGRRIEHKYMCRQMYYRWGLRGVTYYAKRQVKNSTVLKPNRGISSSTDARSGVSSNTKTK